jgi:glycosyltransferase involved in cell wall biosynthesis
LSVANAPDITEASRRSPGRDRAKPKLLELCAVDYTAHFLLLPLARALRRDFDVHFVSSPGHFVAPIAEEGFVYHTVRIERSYNVIAHLRALATLRRLMERERYAVVHTHTPVASLIGRAAARLARVPVVLYTAHGFYFHERMRPAARRLFVILERIGARLTDFTFTQSREDHDAAVALGIVDRERVLHIANGVDLGRFDPERWRPYRHRIRQSLGIGENALVVTIIGRLVREKGYLELIEAFARVAAQFPDAVLVAVAAALDRAHDDASREVRQSIDRLGLGSRVLLLEAGAPAEEVLAASDVYVLPSHREGLPRSILEAMAMGLPVVATDVRGSREVVVHGVTGTVVGVGDAEGLGAALAELLADRDRRTSYGATAASIARREFDEADVIEKQRGVVLRLCREKGLLPG